MTIIGFNFTKILAEKTGNLSGKIGINNNVSLTEVKAMDINLGLKENKGLMVRFDYSCSYDPQMGRVNLQGEIITVDSEDAVKKAVESWSKKQMMDKTLTEKVMSYILNKCTIQAILISRDVGLPSPVPLPKVNIGKSETKNDAKK